MSQEPDSPAPDTQGLHTAATPASAPAPASQPAGRRTVIALVVVAGAALAASLMLWQRLGDIQMQLARQSADTGASAIEARALARQALEQARDIGARHALLESRLNEVELQRGQLETLMQSLSLSRDETLLSDVESSLRLAQQQTQLTGSPEPLLHALRTADQRLARTPQPRLARVRAALARDMDRVRAATVTDVPGVLARLDELVRQVDELQPANAVGVPPAPRSVRRPASAAASAASAPGAAAALWWQQWVDAVWEDVRSLVRVSRIDQPEAVLVAPEQVFFLRENLKLKLLNARLSLIARQIEVARADVGHASAAVHKYFDPAARRTQAAVAQLQQVQAMLRSTDLPRVDETFAALAAAGVGR